MGFHCHFCVHPNFVTNNINKQGPAYAANVFLDFAFNENMKILEKIKEKKCSPLVPGDRLLSSLQYSLNTDWKYI